MIHAYKTSYFFILVTFWLNSAMASEYKPLPVPSYHATHSKNFSLVSMMSRISLPNMPSIPSPNFGKLLENVDFSCGTKIVQEHKMMLGVATSVIFLSFLVKQLQKSDIWKESLQQKYADTEKLIYKYTKRCIKQCPPPIRLAITPLKIVIQFLCNAIKRYVAMNSKTIIFSVASPVTGRLLDSVIGCPIPFLNFTSIGGMVSGVVITKGYFDSSFAKVDERFDGLEAQVRESDKKNTEQHSATQEKIGLVQHTINGVSDKVNNLFDKIKNLDTGVSQIREQVGSVSGQVKDILKNLMGMEKQVALLHDKIDQQDKKAIQQCEELQKRLQKLEELLYQKAERDEVLRLELQGFKSTYESNHADLRKDLGITSTRLSQQIDGVKEDIRSGFASQNRYLDSSDHKDRHIQLLQLQLGQQNTNNS